MKPKYYKFYREAVKRTCNQVILFMNGGELDAHYCDSSMLENEIDRVAGDDFVTVLNVALPRHF